jgi:nucleotide-binding universal stress UspA family protein
VIGARKKLLRRRWTVKMRKAMFASGFGTMTLSELKALLPLKGVGLEEIILYHVLQIKDVGFVPYGGFLKEVQEKLEAEALIRFRDWGKVVVETGLKYRTLVKVGVPWRSILFTAQKELVHLIALGTKHDDPEELDISSTVLKIVRHSEIPMLIMKRVADAGDNLFKNVLLPMDFSLPSERALGVVMGLASLVEKVELVHVLSEKEVKEFSPQEIEPKVNQGMKNLNVYVQGLAELGLEARAHVFVGNTAKEILQSAEDLETTLIVMGTTGKDVIKEFWMGSASHRVAELAQCSVLLVS